jgi:hypothetical protein
MLMPVRFRHGLSPESFGTPSRQAHAFTPPMFRSDPAHGFSVSAARADQPYIDDRNRRPSARLRHSNKVKNEGPTVFLFSLQDREIATFNLHNAWNDQEMLPVRDRAQVQNEVKRCE